MASLKWNVSFLSLTLTVVSLLCSVQGDVKLVDGKLPIKLLTTSLCGDTVWFITTSLKPVYEELGEYLSIEFVPWGKTVRNVQTNELTCQFGVNDCRANRIQTCVLEQLRTNQTAQIEYMNCEFTTFNAALYNYGCALNEGVDVIRLERCVVTSEGDDLIAAAELATNEGMTATNFVPTVIYNNVVDVTQHTNGFNSFRATTCALLQEAYPNLCL